MKVLSIVASALVLLGSISCNTRTEEKIENTAIIPAVEPFSVDTSRIVIINNDSLAYPVFSEAKPAILNMQDLRIIEESLASQLTAYNRIQEDRYKAVCEKYPKLTFNISHFIIRSDEYRRQYVAVINSEGEKEVWVNCFCSDDKNWKTAKVDVDDGGNCYFNFKINIQHGKLYEFRVNGF